MFKLTLDKNTEKNPGLNKTVYPMKEKILVASKDFDGCIFNVKNYHPSVDKDVIAHNLPLWNYLEQRRVSFSKTYSMVGSARQSKGIDAEGSITRRTGSCFTAIQKIADHLSFTVEPFLLSDTWGDLPAGTSYNRLMGANFKKEKHHCNVYDDSKLTIVYAQIHHIATKHPEAAIVYDFYDDKFDILEKLFEFFSEFPEMLPASVTLCLHQYKGSEVNAMEEINGIGKIDKDYRQTVVYMMELTNIDVFFMPVDEVICKGFQRCYVWHQSILSYIDEFGAVCSDMPIKYLSLSPFAWLHRVCESNQRKQFRLKSEYIDQLIKLNRDLSDRDLLDRDLYVIRKGLSTASGIQCVDVVKPALLTRFQSCIESGSRTRDFLYTQKSVNVQLLIEQHQDREDKWTFDPNINLPNQKGESLNDSSNSGSSDESDSESMDLTINKTEQPSSKILRHSVSAGSFFESKTKRVAGMLDLISGAVCHESILKKMV